MNTITMTVLRQPSRSKGRMWAGVGEAGQRVFASEAGRSAEIDSDDGTFDLFVGGEIRRASRTERIRESVQLMATGDPADVATVSVGSPQPIVVSVSGAREVEA